MATVGIRPFVEHVGSRRTEGKLMEIKVVQATVDPPSLLTETGATVAITSFTGPSFSANAFLIPNPPAALEAGLVAMGVEVNGVDSILLGVANVSAGTVNGAALTWDFLVFDF